MGVAFIEEVFFIEISKNVIFTTFKILVSEHECFFDSYDAII